MGGIHDGLRIKISGPLPKNLFLPVQKRAEATDYCASPIIGIESIRFERAGIRDDGTHWYKLVG